MTHPRVVVDATAIPARLTGAGVHTARVLAELATFTWERCAAGTAAAYSRALDDPARASSARPRGDSR
ncbi:MAG TPA: hypothetical protein VH016_07800 [Actinomycetota bacterium]|nr:hypothetical protein [Actinomycetota bacterium]